MEVTEKQQEKVSQSFPKGHLFVAASLACAAAIVFSLFPSDDAAATRQTTYQVEIDLAPRATPEQQPEVVQAIEEPTPWREFTVHSGDSLSLIFQRAGLSDRDVYAVINGSAEAKSLKSIFPGQQLAFNVDASGQLQSLRYTTSKLTHETYTRTDTGFEFEKVEQLPDIITAFRHAEIKSSLFLAGQEAGMEPSLIMELANIFGWDVDFALDIRAGDSFSLVYQERFLNGEKYDNGDILAAEFVNQGQSFKAVRYTDAEGNSHFYTPDGNSMRKEFLRTPVDFARISSHFNLRRKHPVLHSIRAHKGTDYAASTGTPIRATGDGKVIHSGRKGGYGNAVILQHGQTYKTLYAHMSKFAKGVRAGSRVKQGQVIGYVGSTGLATGPHLHFEFYVNGAVRNPVTVPLPKASSIANSELPRFYSQTGTALAALEDYQRTTQMASAGNP